MAVTFANPAGWWALLALPLVLAIHFLQTAARKVTVSTLFLLGELEKENVGGRRWERLRTSVPLWLQLLAVLLLTWVLVQPRWLRSNSSQSIVLILDSSVSMTAFQDRVMPTLARRLAVVARGAARTEWILIESNTARGTLYAGGELQELHEAVKRWTPRDAQHDFDPAIRLGQSLLKGRGRLIFVTDHRAELPSGAELLAIGHPIDNCGFAGLLAPPAAGAWEALVKNHGDVPLTRTCEVVVGETIVASEPLALQPGEMRTLRGRFPTGSHACELRLTPDAFAADDRLPMVATQLKNLSVFSEAGRAASPFFHQIISSGVGVAQDGNAGQADVRLLVADAETMAWPAETTVIFLENPPAGETTLVTGPIVADQDPLMDELNWQGLVCTATSRIPLLPTDRTLLWQGDQSLIFLRANGDKRQLVFNFELHRSNAAHLPALVLLVHRFLDSIRAGKVWPETKNFETNQLLSVALEPAGGPVWLQTTEGQKISIPPGEGASLRAPAVPTFFEVSQGETKLLEAATSFADVREADFRSAGSFDELDRKGHDLRLANSDEDFFSQGWLLALATAMIFNWFWPVRKG